MTTSRLTATAIAAAMMQSDGAEKDERLKRYAHDHQFTSEVVDKEREANRVPVRLKDEHNTIIFVSASNPRKEAAEFTRQLNESRLSSYKNNPHNHAPNVIA